jgi:membrane-associated phospholipid phosphatase
VQFLSDFADQQLLLPLGLIWIAILMASGWWRGMAAWTAVMVGTLGCLTVLKVVFLACGRHWTGGELTSPSGHTGAAALFYGGYALLLLRPRGGLRHAVLLIPPVLAAIVGLSRIMLHAHTVVEVAVGGAIGCAGAFLLQRLAGVPPSRLPARLMLVPTVLVPILLHGDRLHAEHVLRRFTIEGVWPPASCEVDQPAAADTPTPAPHDGAAPAHR